MMLNTWFGKQNIIPPLEEPFREKHTENKNSGDGLAEKASSNKVPSEEAPPTVPPMASYEAEPSEEASSAKASSFNKIAPNLR